MPHDGCEIITKVHVNYDSANPYDPNNPPCLNIEQGENEDELEVTLWDPARVLRISRPGLLRALKALGVIRCTAAHG